MTENAPEEGSWKSRACPGIRALFTSFSLRSSGGRVLVRRVSMWTILVSRIIISIGIITNRLLGGRIISVVLGIIFAVLNLLFTIWCLSVIDRAAGYRNVCCLRVGRTHLDNFLVLAAVLHIVLLVGVFAFFKQNWIFVNAMWFTLWALMAVYGCICTSFPDSAA